MSRYLSRLAARSGIAPVSQSVATSVSPGSGRDSKSTIAPINSVSSDIEVHDETVFSSQLPHQMRTKNDASSDRQPSEPIMTLMNKDVSNNQSVTVKNMPTRRDAATGIDSQKIVATDLIPDLGEHVSGTNHDDAGGTDASHQPKTDDMQAHSHIERNKILKDRSDKADSTNSVVQAGTNSLQPELSAPLDMDVEKENISAAMNTVREQGSGVETAVTGLDVAEHSVRHDSIDNGEMSKTAEISTGVRYERTVLKVPDNPSMHAMPMNVKSSGTDIHVRIGNVNVEVHKATPVHEAPAAPQPAAPVRVSSPLRLSRHYLRGW